MSRDWVKLTWGEMTWWERVQMALSFVLALVITGAAFIGFILFVLGPALDGISRHKSEHERCLKNATNGWEIKQCR
ncbi:MAG: hypothetical protein H0U63_04575 [Burkholderiales bacterium]|nr:hypothetical protein [Burkholderiales bacterium]